MSLRTRKLDLVKDPILTAYTNGVSLEEIAKGHGVSKGTVRNLIIAEGLLLRKQGRPKNIRITDSVSVKENE